MKITMTPTHHITTNRNVKIGVPTRYKGCIIVPVNSGFDVVDVASGRWMHVPNQRTAKWNATVWTRLRDEFGDSLPLATLPVVQMIVEPKEKNND